MRRTEEETKLFYKCYRVTLARTKSMKDAYLFAERMYKRKTKKRYYKNYESFRAAKSQRMKLKRTL